MKYFRSLSSTYDCHRKQEILYINIIYMDYNYLQIDGACVGDCNTICVDENTSPYFIIEQLNKTRENVKNINIIYIPYIHK